MDGGNDVKVMVWTPEPGIANAIVSAPGWPFASRIAWRSDPVPESFVFVTVNVSAKRPEVPEKRTARKPLAYRFMAPSGATRIGGPAPWRERRPSGRG